MKTTITIPSSEIKAPFNLKFHLEHYVTYPWLVEDEKLVRILLLKSGRVVKVETVLEGSEKKPRLKLTVLAKQKLSRADLQEVKETIAWCLGIDEDVREFYDKVVPSDPVLTAAVGDYCGVRFEAPPTVFEAIIGVVVAQNVQFKRIYTMLYNLCHCFGSSLKLGKKKYYAFPTPEQLAAASLPKIRACKVGYRDKYLKGIAEAVIKEKLDLEGWKKIESTEEIRERLMKLPGIGPYTADLTLSLGFRRPAFHLDLFTREVMQTFYFNGKKVSDKKILDYVDKHFGNWRSLAMLFLTTNTDEWAVKLGKKFRLKSGAKG